MKYKVWQCKVVVPWDVELPRGFDLPPRRAVIEAIEAKGIKVITCFSGWGSDLTEGELQIVDKDYETLMEEKNDL